MKVYEVCYFSDPNPKVYYFSDPYVKVWLMFGEKRVEKKKTPVYKCNLNPTFNQVFIKKKVYKCNLNPTFNQVFITFKNSKP